MDIIINGFLILAIFPIVAFFYANLSNLVQLIFNKKFDDAAFKTKWQLNSYASYTIVGTGLLNFINGVFINSTDFSACINISVVVSSLWYLLMLIKNYFKSKSA